MSDPAASPSFPVDSGRPRELTEVTWSEKEMSNFDHTIDPGMEEDLRAGMRGCHSAWDFHGEVWYDPGEDVFKEEVSVYGAVCGTLAAPALEELMQVVNDEYGWR